TVGVARAARLLDRRDPGGARHPRGMNRPPCKIVAEPLSCWPMSQTPTIPTRSATELRRAFLEFFRERQHTIVPSSPLVPHAPTLLFTTAGMVQFKPYFIATGDVPYTRTVSSQTCLRLSDLGR